MGIWQAKVEKSRRIRSCNRSFFIFFSYSLKEQQKDNKNKNQKEQQKKRQQKIRHLSDAAGENSEKYKNKKEASGKNE
ncbi:MAG: hypothetical protein HFI93_05870 [Lachnospiraceae bacterium]|nr:hypothetical protein [Lachnospiraceae bacterium]